MLRSILTILTFIAVAVNTAGAARPGVPGRELSHLTYDDIEAFMADTTEYHTLKSRLLKGDRSLTLHEYAMVYYGGSFTPAYDPVQLYAQLMVAGMIAKDDEKEAIEYCREILEGSPWTVCLLKLGGYYSLSQRRFIDEMFFAYYYDKLCEVIWHSGDGSAEYPFQVIHRGDAFELPGIEYSVEPLDNGPFSPNKITLSGYDEEGNVIELHYAFDLTPGDGDDFY